MAKRKDKINHFPIIKPYHALYGKTWFNTQVDTMNTKFLDGIRVFADNATLKILNNCNFNFNGDEIGKWLFNNLNKVIFLDITFQTKLDYYLIYNYELNVFKLIINTDTARNRKYYDPEELFINDLCKRSIFVPVIIMDPVAVLKISKEMKLDKLIRFEFPYKMWLTSFGELSKKLEKRILMKATANDISISNNYPILSIEIKDSENDNILQMYDSADEGYVLDCLAFDTNIDTYAEDVEKLINDDPILNELACREMATADNIKEENKLSEHQRDILKHFVFHNYLSIAEVTILHLMGVYTYRFIYCLKRLYRWAEDVSFVDNDGDEKDAIKFTNGKTNIYLHSDYLKISRKRYVLNGHMLNLYLSGDDEYIRVAKDNWGIYTLPVVEEKDEENNMESSINVDETNVTKDGNIEMISSDKPKSRAELIKEFVMYSDLFISDRVDILNKKLRMYHNDDCSLDVLETDKISVVTLITEFIEWSMFKYGVILFSDLKLYLSYPNIESYQYLVSIANSVIKNVKYKVEYMNTLLEKFSELEDYQLEYGGDIFKTTLYYHDITTEIGSPSKFYICLTKIPHKTSSYVFFSEDKEMLGYNTMISIGSCVAVPVTEFNLVNNDPKNVYESILQICFNKFVNDINISLK